MDELLYREIKKIRNPFRVIKMPLMARLCKYWYDNLSKKSSSSRRLNLRGLVLFIFIDWVLNLKVWLSFKDQKITIRLNSMQGIPNSPLYT